jgi:hypothetical protein
VISSLAELFGILPGRLGNGQHNRLIADDPSRFVHRIGIDPSALEIRLGPDHEEGGGLGNGMKPGEIGEAAIHDAEGARQRDYVQDVDLVKLSIGDVVKGWNVASQVQQGMETDGTLCLPPARTFILILRFETRRPGSN